MLNNNNPTINLFSEKVGESMTNCSMWTQWATQQETMEIRQKNLAPLSFFINPRFHLSQLLSPSVDLSELFGSTICLKYLSQLFVLSICLNYLSQLFGDHQVKNTVLLLLLWPITALGYYGLALSMSSLGATMINIIIISTLIYIA